MKILESWLPLIPSLAPCQRGNLSGGAAEALEIGLEYRELGFKTKILIITVVTPKWEKARNRRYCRSS